MKVYLTRHGLTDWNIEKRAQGRKDVPLNSTGRAQARELHDKIKHLEFDAVYTSPLVRTVETAKIATDDKYKLIYDDRLLERSFGELEGTIVKSWTELVPGVNTDDIYLDKIPGNVEPIKEMLARATSFIDYLKENYSNNAKILIVGHGSMARVFDWLLSEHVENAVFGDTPPLGHAEGKGYEI